MASVGTAYMDVKPDLSNFGRSMQTSMRNGNYVIAAGTTSA